MSTFAVTDPNDTLAAINYILTNLGPSGNANVTIPANVVTANANTGIITTYGNTSGTPYWFQFQYVNLRYANNASGTSGFTDTPTNSNYFGIYNSITSTPSTNPAAYTWTQVAGGFGNTKIIYYSAIGGRQAQWAAANVAPSSAFVASVPNVAIDLDIVTTANGTPGSRGPLAMGYVITTADPTVASSATLTGWFQAPRANIVAPIGTGLTPVTGDTASFIYIAGNTQPSAVFSYNGSVWANVVAQVIPGNTIVANTITGNTIAQNTITGNNIVINTITGNLIAANTITSNRIAAGTITATNIAVGANITGNMIAAGTITANNLAANTLTANTVVSTGANIGNNSSQGFWLQGNTGNARFGNNLSIGNNLTVGSNAQIGGNLTIGNNVSIGANLTVAGLISAGSLTANTVATTQIVQGTISGGSTGNSNANILIVSSPNLSIQYGSNIFANIATVDTNQNTFLWSQLPVNISLGGSNSVTWTGNLTVRLNRNIGNSVTTIFQQNFGWAQNTSNSSYTATAVFSGFIDTITTPSNVSYTMTATVNNGNVLAPWTLGSLAFGQRSILCQTLKR